MSSTIATDSKQWEELSNRVQKLEAELKAREGTCIVLFSGDLDRVLASLNLATASASAGEKTTIFFTFWGTTALLKKRRARGKSLVERAFSFLLPRGTSALRLSRLHMCGAGTTLMNREMKKKGAPRLEELMEMCAELGVQFEVCEMTMSIMGIRREELRDYPDLQICGAMTCVGRATNSSASFFV